MGEIGEGEGESSASSFSSKSSSSASTSSPSLTGRRTLRFPLGPGADAPPMSRCLLPAMSPCCCDPVNPPLCSGDEAELEDAALDFI